ncbi:MAG: ribosome assembly RNA-binding protein YhbY [Myxococcales bacterium]|nr:ribosome assembly RNA-binding protein YhbY [Myxococcales bacterium]
MGASLTGRARTYLKSLAHPLEPVVQVGAQGITDGLCEAVDVALRDHELIKVRLGQNFEGDRHEAGDAIAAATGARVVQVIGRVIVLFRARPRDKKDTRPRIELPRG